MRALLFILLLSACDESSSHVYLGRLYLTDRKCLGTTSSVDVVSGDTTGTCAPVCLVKDSTVYVGTSCAPYPPGYDSSGVQSICAEALAANGRDDTCLADGGSTHP